MKMLGSGLFSPSLLIAFGFGTGLSLCARHGGYRLGLAKL